MICVDISYIIVINNMHFSIILSGLIMFTNVKIHVTRYMYIYNENV